MAIAELVLDCKTALGESPVCTAEAVHFVDIEGCAIHTYIPSSKEHTQISTRGQKVGCVVPYTAARGDAPGANLLAGLPDSIVSINSGSKTITSTPFAKFPATHGGPKFRCNDGKCDPSGRLWIGTMNAAVHEDANVTEKGRLYRLSKASDGKGQFTLTDIIGNVRCSNGMAWEGSSMFFIDSYEQSVDVLDYCTESGEVSNRRVAIRIPRDQGVPDGMTIDASGKLWVAMWKGGAVLQYDPSTAQQISRVQVPARYTTSCCFGGKDLSELYITSAAIPDDGTGPDMTSEHPGGLFKVQIPGVKGIAYSQPFLG